MTDEPTTDDGPTVLRATEPSTARRRVVALLPLVAGLVVGSLIYRALQSDPMTSAERERIANEAVANHDRWVDENTVEITTTTVDRDGSDRFYGACADAGRAHRSCPNHPRGEQCTTDPAYSGCPGDPREAEGDAAALERTPVEPISDVWFINTDPIRGEPRYGTVEAWCDQWWDGLPSGAIEPLVFLRSAPTDDMLSAAAHVAVVQLIGPDDESAAADIDRYEHAVAWLDATCRPLYP